MAKYKVLEQSFINNTLVQAGDIVEYDGEAGPNLEPLNKRKAKDAEVVVDEQPVDPETTPTE